MRISREPVVLVQGLLVPVALAVVLFLHLGDVASGALNTLIMVAGGLVAAWGVAKVDAVLPLAAGAAKAVLAVLLAFGLHVPDSTQTLALSVIGIVVAFLTRPQVTAKTQVAVAA